MEIRIERITRADGPLAEGIARLMPQLGAGLQVPSAERLRALAADDRTALFAAREAGTVVGMLTLVWYDALSGRKAWIEDVAVDAAYRGRGAGRALVEAALAHAAAVGADRVSLTSNPSRTAAHALYLKTGFDKAETTLFVRKITKR